MVARWSLGDFLQIFELGKEVDVELGLKEVHYCECIGRDIGYGSCGEIVMLWDGLGGRLGVDLLGRSVVAR